MSQDAQFGGLVVIGAIGVCSSIATLVLLGNLIHHRVWNTPGDRLFILLTAFEVIKCVDPLITFSYTSGEPHPWVCSLQAWVMAFSYLGSSFFAVFIAIYILLHVIRRIRFPFVVERWTTLAIITGCFVNATILAMYPQSWFGLVEETCWLLPQYGLYQVWHLWFPMLIAVSLALILLSIIFGSISWMGLEARSKDPQVVPTECRKLIGFPIVFAASYLPYMIDRILYGNGIREQIFTIIVVAWFAGQGLFNALVYGYYVMTSPQNEVLKIVPSLNPEFKVEIHRASSNTNTAMTFETSGPSLDFSSHPSPPRHAEWKVADV
eukprot:TRINITY_DN9789_c0_g1_i1.p1 TRINITY_DN9789_c0_g1~~TRINITY_DN9789_c0_g1_i1.p1  ORF type:complete len:322 (-),score=13.24 TRINITY_DN9789_c0_g1_i1:72-1037(-)